jgi:uncharacterized membrane protein
MGKIFKRGLIAIAPLALAIVIVVWLLGTLEHAFRPPIKAVLGEKYYIPGMGILVALILIFIVGAVINTYIIQKISGWVDRFLARLPFFKIFYNSIGDMMNYFRPKGREHGKMVIVQIEGTRRIGIVTREDFEGVAKGIEKEGEIAVFIPMSYQIGGFTVLVHKSKVEPIEMSVDEGMRFIITGGVLGHKK